MDLLLTTMILEILCAPSYKFVDEQRNEFCFTVTQISYKFEAREPCSFGGIKVLTYRSTDRIALCKSALTFIPIYKKVISICTTQQ